LTRLRRLSMRLRASASIISPPLLGEVTVTATKSASGRTASARPSPVTESAPSPPCRVLPLRTRRSNAFASCASRRRCGRWPTTSSVFPPKLVLAPRDVRRSCRADFLRPGFARLGDLARGDGDDIAIACFRHSPGVFYALRAGEAVPPAPRAVSRRERAVPGAYRLDEFELRLGLDAGRKGSKAGDY